MKKIIVLGMLMISFITSAQDKKNKNAKYTIEVSGNCDMCKKRIEKAAFSVSGVKNAVWYADEQALVVILNEEKANVLSVQKAIAKVGHDTKEVKATKEDYDNLHDRRSFAGRGREAD